MNKCTVFITDENNNAIDEENDAKIDDFLKNFFPAELANFYFSTGKNLEEVKSTTTMDEEMESVLGLSKLALLQKILNNMSKKQQTILSAKQKQSKQQQNTQLQIQLYNSRIDNAQNEINSNNNLIKEIDDSKLIIETKLEGYPDNIKDLLEERKTIKSKISDIDRQINSKKTEAIENTFKDVWKGLVYKKFIQSEKTTGLNHDEQDLIRSLKALRINESTEFKTELFDSNKIGNDLANVIDNHYNKISENSSRSEFADYRLSVDNFIEQYDSYEKLTDDKNILEFNLETIDKNIGSLSDQDGDTLTAELKLLDKKLKNIDDLKESNDRLKRNIAENRDKRNEEEKKLQNFKIDSRDIDAVKDRIISDIIRCVDTAMYASKEASHSLFHKYVNEFHDKLKDPIRNQNYSIKIDKSYEYMIMENRHGKFDPILNPTGSEDVYARVSMNLALVKIAVHKFPIFLDNPIEQLNDDGKERLTRIFENLERQLIIILFDEKGSNNFWQSPKLIHDFYNKSKSYSLSNDSENIKKTNIRSLNL